MSDRIPKAVERAIDAFRSLLLLGLVAAAAVWWFLPSTPPVPPASAIVAAAPLDVRELAMRHAVTTGSLAACKLPPLPRDASTRWSDFLAKRDPDAFVAGVARGATLLKGAALQPGSAACKDIAARQTEFSAVVVEAADLARQIETSGRAQ